MKTKFKSTIHAACHSFSGVVCAGAVLLIASNAQAQNLFASDYYSGNIYEYTPSGVQSTFASGLADPFGLAFNSAGNLFEADGNEQPFPSGTIYEFTTNGVRTTFASEAAGGLAFDSAGNLFEADFFTGTINEFTPGGTQTTFASGLNYPTGLAFQGVTLPVPEPSVLGLLAIGFTALLVRRSHKLAA